MFLGALNGRVYLKAYINQSSEDTCSETIKKKKEDPYWEKKKGGAARIKPETGE